MISKTKIENSDKNLVQKLVIYILTSTVLNAPLSQIYGHFRATSQSTIAIKASEPVCMRRGECYVCALSQSVRVYSNKPDRAVNHGGRCGALAPSRLELQLKTLRRDSFSAARCSPILITYFIALLRAP
jgi:hypothetical protein